MYFKVLSDSSAMLTVSTQGKWGEIRGQVMYFKILNDGSAVLTINSQRTTDAYTFEAFGNPTGQSGTTVNPFRYVGALGYYWFDFAHHGRDRTSGLRLLGARLRRGAARLHAGRSSGIAARPFSSFLTSRTDRPESVRGSRPGSTGPGQAHRRG